MTRSDSNNPATSFLAGGGEMGERMRAMDWSATPLGSPDTWPQSLRSTISMLVPSKAQIILFWGPDFTVFYNDAYRPVFGAKHPLSTSRTTLYASSPAPSAASSASSPRRPSG
jgi:hypothetical protein